MVALLKYAVLVPYKGDSAGAIIVFSEKMPDKLCNKYGFKVSSVRGDPLGTRLI